MPKKKKKSTGQVEDDFGPSYNYVMPQEAWLVGIGFRFITGKLLSIIDDGGNRSVGDPDPVETTKTKKNQLLELHICGNQSVTIQYTEFTVLIGDPKRGHMVTVTTYAHDSAALCIERLL
ncbi:hypothetical protein [Candidatus Nitrospira salsa]